MSATLDLAQVIADWRGDGQVLRRHKQHTLADQLDKCAETVEASAKEWLTWLNEGEAMLRSERSRNWLRGQYAAWERDGHARTVGTHRQYRMTIVPRRHSLSRARLAGAEAAKLARTQRAA